MSKVKKSALLIAGAAAVPVVLCIIAVSFFFSSKNELAVAHARQKEFALLKSEYQTMKSGIDVIENKKSISNVKGILQAVDEIFLSLGLKQRIRSVKPLTTQEAPGLVEEEAEVQVERVNINEAVNLFYKIENAPMSIFIKKAAMKASFENPANLDITITIALVRPK
ncbi:MAG: hypothetical protein ACLQF0_13735 [Dissulfurispiraceae bacterium]